MEIDNSQAGEPITQEEPPVQGDYHEAVSLWPLLAIALVAAVLIATVTFLPDAKQRAASVPYGKTYSAVGTILDCQAIYGFGNGPYRSFIRTPKDEIFSVYWRRDHQPPPFGMAIGGLKYHECGTQDGVAVHCFDSFAFTGEGAKQLDNNGKPIPQTGAVK